MFASFQDFSGIHAGDEGYSHDTGAGTLNDIYEAYGYGDDYTDDHFSDGEDIRNFWFGNDPAECAENAEQTETDDVADPSIEEVESDEDEPPQSARLLLGTFPSCPFRKPSHPANHVRLAEYHAPDTPSVQDESSEEDSFEDSKESPNGSDGQRETTVDEASDVSQTPSGW
jgi:hypothetical protein